MYRGPGLRFSVKNDDNMYIFEHRSAKMQVIVIYYYCIWYRK